jgi:hypothetical protein
MNGSVTGLLHVIVKETLKEVAMSRLLMFGMFTGIDAQKTGGESNMKEMIPFSLNECKKRSRQSSQKKN